MNEIKSIKITILTPVHIGSGVKLKKGIDFFIKKDKFGVVDDKKILSIIGEDQIGIWVSAIDKGESILPYIEKRKPGYKLTDISKRVYPLTSTSGTKDAREMMHTPLGNPIIPGSSLKGAIRTALWDKYGDANIKLDDIINIWHGNISYKDKNLSKKIFGKNPNKDILRFLQITDAIFHNDNCGKVEVVNVLTLKNDGWKIKHFEEYAECISPESNADFRIKIAKDTLIKNINKNFIKNDNKTNSLQSISGLFSICNDYYKKMLDKEIEFFKQDIDLKNDEKLDKYLSILKELRNTAENLKNGCILRLGHGTGYRFMTGNKIDSENIKDDDFKQILKNIRKDWRGRYDDWLFIKSRKMTKNGMPLGFVKLTIYN